jgi:hypothetical protein
MLVMTVVFSGTCVWAADQERDREQLTEQDQERLRDQDIYGWELMSREERQEHRRMMRSLNTREERERYRQEHHERMQERARAQGRVLPDMPSEGGRGMGPGGGGMGPGGGGYGMGGGR